METRLKMRYLKNYKIFESSDIVSDIKDIFLLEIKDIDEGYDVQITSGYLDNLEDQIIVEISKWSSIIQNEPRNRTFGKRISFELTEIEDGVHRILNYMGDLGYKNEVLTKLNTRDSWTGLVMKEGDYTRYKLGPHEWRFDKRISRVKITFEK